MADRHVCFAMALYPPGAELHPTFYSEELRVCSPVLDTLRTTITMVIGFIANAGALVLIWFSRKQEHVPTSYNIPNILVLVLCSTDLVWLLFGESVWSVSILFGSWQGGASSYFYTTFISTVCLRFSGCVVVLMGVERYLSLLRPFFYDHSVTLQRIFLTILVLIVYSVVMSCFHLAGELQSESYPCNASDTSFCYTRGNETIAWRSVVTNAYDYLTFVESLASVAILVFCNVFVVRCMRQMRRRIDLVCPRNRDEYMKQVDMIRGVSAEFSRLMVGITLVTVITIIPYEIRVLCNHFEVWYSPLVDYISAVLHLSNTTINPLMYGVFRRKYRRKFWRKLVKLLVRCRRGNQVRPQENLDGKDNEPRADHNVVVTSSDT